METCILLPLMTAGVSLYLYRTKRLGKGLLACLLAGTALAAVLLVQEYREGPRQEVTELSADTITAGTTAAEGSDVELTMKTEEGEEAFTLHIPEKESAAEERRATLEEEAAQLDDRILGNNTSLSHVEWNLSLPSEGVNDDVSIFWMSSRPDLLTASGEITGDVPEEGAEVTLTAQLTLGEETLEAERTLTVFPSQEKTAFAERVQKEADALNAGQDSDTYRLPSEVGGVSLTWYRDTEQTGQNLCLLLLMAAFFAALASGKRKEEAQKKRQEELLRAYPGLLSKTHLLLAAGLSLRRVFERLAADYRRERKRTGHETPLGEELLRTWYDMENGVLEPDAFAQLGERCGLAEYKSFALLLAQNQTRGGHHLPQLLEAEVQQAFEERKRRARVAGEKAAIRLAFPMGMMLVVVLVMVLVPALLSF